jgi:Holliday junction resolvase RusA-like endonuclease
MTTAAMPVGSPHRLDVVAYGLPAPQGSKRHVGRGILIDHNPDALGTWREDVKLAALRAVALNPGWDRTYPALVGHFTFTMPRPRHHFRTGRFANELRGDAPHLHSTRPDLDKLLRSTWDALTSAGAYADDCRLAQVYAIKVYTGGGPGALDRPGVSLSLAGVAR